MQMEHLTRLDDDRKQVRERYQKQVYYNVDDCDDECIGEVNELAHEFVESLQLGTVLYAHEKGYKRHDEDVEGWGRNY